MPMPDVCTEALNQGENVDLDALMADLSTIEQELGGVNAKAGSSGSSLARLGLTDTKVPTRTVAHVQVKSLRNSHDKKVLVFNCISATILPTRK